MNNRLSMLVFGVSFALMIANSSAVIAQRAVDVPAAGLPLRPQQPGGLLANELGTYLKIEGVLYDGSGKAESNSMVVDTVNGTKLDKPVIVLVKNMRLPAKKRCVLRGYELGEMIGRPPAEHTLAKELGRDPNKLARGDAAAWHWRPYFVPFNWIEGHVLNRMGKPLEGVEVRGLTPEEGAYSSFSSPSGHDPLGEEYTAKTDSDGYFRLEGLPKEFKQIGLSLSIPGWHVNTKKYVVNHFARIEMDRPDRVIRGIVVDDETGEPVQEFSVSVYGKHGTFSDAKGAFVIGGLWPYRYQRVFVDAKGYQRTIARNISAEPEETASPHTIRIRKTKVPDASKAP